MALFEVHNIICGAFRAHFASLRSTHPGRSQMEFTSHDGKTIWYKLWEAPSPRAVIQIMTGLAEVADYYEDFANEMVKAGYTVALHEYRGHGRTRADYGESNLFRNYARDGASLNTILRTAYPGLPVVLFAHSLGTTVSQIAIYEKLTQWDGIVYTGPSHAVIDPERKEYLLGVTDRDILLHGDDATNVMIYPLVFGRLNAPFASGRRTGGTPDRSSFAFITSDLERRKWLTALPYENPSYTNRFFRDFIIMQADLAIHETLENTQPPLTDVPVLLLTGSDDVTAANGTYGDTQAQLLRDAGCRDVTSIVYPRLRHSLLQETEREKVTADILSWLERRF